MHVRLIKPWRTHAVDAIVDVSDKTGQRLIDSGSAVLSGPPEPTAPPEPVQPETILPEPPTLEASTVGNVLPVESAATVQPPEELPSLAPPQEQAAIPMRHQARRNHYQTEG